MANLFLQKITKPISIEKGAMPCLLENFQKDKNCLFMHLVKLMEVGTSYFVGNIFFNKHCISISHSNHCDNMN